MEEAVSRAAGAAPALRAKALGGAAAFAHLQGDYGRAARLYGAAEALCEAGGMRPPPLTAAWAPGRALSWEQAVVEALSEGTSEGNA